MILYVLPTDNCVLLLSGINRNLCCLQLQRLQTKVLKLVDVSYGGENGFNQAIELSAEVLTNVKFIQEKKLIGTYHLKHVFAYVS